MRAILITILGAITALLIHISLPLFPSVKRAFGIAPYLPWHQNPAWERLLTAIDKNNEDKIPECSKNSTMIDTDFGQTQVYACGNPQHTPIVLHHAAMMTSNMWGQWMLPRLLDENYYVIMPDFICTNGNSVPKDGDPQNCPATEQEIATWVDQIVSGLELKTPVSMLGASYGALVSFLTALHKRNLVDRLVLISPGGIFFDLNPSWIKNWLIHASFPSSATHDWFYTTMNSNESSHATLDRLAFEQEMAKLDVLVPIYTVTGRLQPDQVLRDVLKEHPTFVGIGEQEVLLPRGKTANDVAELAKNNGVTKSVVYPKANHDIFSYSPTRERLLDDIVHFLKDDEDGKDDERVVKSEPETLPSLE